MNILQTKNADITRQKGRIVGKNSKSLGNGPLKKGAFHLQKGEKGGGGPQKRISEEGGEVPACG